MSITFGDVRTLVASYVGRGGACADAKETELFARQVLEKLMISGSFGSTRKFEFVAEKGRVTLPPELEVPLQVKINDQVGTVWNRWMTFHSVAAEVNGCSPAGKVLMEEPNPVCTIYSVPAGGSKIGILGTCNEAENSFITVSGKDLTGREIFTMFDGEQISGEKFRIKKDNLRTGQVVFGEITGVVKSKTKGYVQLWATNNNNSVQQFLGDYSPLEEVPQYRSVKLLDNNCGQYVKVTIIGRIKLKEKYADNDIVPFDSSITMMLAAQQLQSEGNYDSQNAAYKNTALDKILEQEAGYKKVSPGTPVNVFHPLSGGAVKGIRR